MTAIELNTLKMDIIRNIINEFNSESALRRLASACQFILNDTHAIDEATLQRFTDYALAQADKGETVLPEDLLKEVEQW